MSIVTVVVSSTTSTVGSTAFASSSPIAKLVPTTGMVEISPSVPNKTPLRSSVLPWLKMTTADAPAAVAKAAFSPKVQVPRWMSATSPAVKPAKSASSHPDVDARSPTRFTSIAVIVVS